eukprot:jgi/Tetstr1/438195/TSEL_026795.t1
MKSHPTAATRLRNLKCSDAFAVADNPGTLTWDQLCTHLDRRGVARTVRHLLALQQPESPYEDQGAFTRRMLNAYHELNDSPVSLHSSVLHENVLVAATLAGMHNNVPRDTIFSALDAAETRAEDISYSRLCDMMHRHPTTPDSKPARTGQDVAAFAAAMMMHSLAFPAATGFLSVFCGKATAPLPVATSGMFLVDGGANICLAPDILRFRAYSPLTTPVPCSGLGVDILGFGSIDISVAYTDGVSRPLAVHAAHAPGMTVRGAPTILSQEYLRREHGVSFSYHAHGAPSAADSHGSLILTMVNDLSFLTGGHAESPWLPSPSAANGAGGVPYCLLHGVPQVDLSDLRVFGCTAYLRLEDRFHLKLEPRALKCMMVGQCDDGPGYWLYKLQSCRVIRSIHVAFLEVIPADVPPCAHLADSSPDTARSTNPFAAAVATASRIMVHDTIKQALASKYHEEWRASIVSELRSLRARNTFAYARLPVGRHAIGTKWVFKVKANSDGSVSRFKARLVAQGFSQQAGVDYHATFSPVVKFSTLRTCLAVAAARGMHIHHIDI